MDEHERIARLVFNEALQIASPIERDTFVRATCGTDAALCARVEALLAAHEEAGSFLEAGASLHDAPTALHGPGLEGAGTHIGRYKLLEEIGEGGFGTVWMAEQREPVQRKVALKVIKLGMDTKEVIARFEAERQALAMMDHPHIAKVLDGGATEAGRPYFVMELVRGVPITQYCDENGLTPQQRLELFVSVCQAIQHAHQKGIIHRDVKPTNVLVSRHDERPVVKVIDFGIAKATGGRLTDKTFVTELRQMIGTPAYMSPEQAGLSDLDIDTRSDIYSLGVLLYELLTGTPPFDIKTLLGAGYAEIQRIIREVEPPKPSLRLSTLKDELPSVAARRRIEPAKLSKLVQGDLDWIVMKCLEKDRSRRYETASGLAADIQRYLGGEAVVAAPPSAAYRLRKFVRRNRAAVTAVSLTAGALILGIIGTSYGLLWAIWERDRATQEASRAKALNDFMQQMILSANPEQSGNRAVTVVEMLSKASEEADRTLRDDPIAEGEARTFLASTLRAVGKVDQAAKEAQRGVELRESGIERNTLHHADSLRTLAKIQMARGEYSAALASSRDALSILSAVSPIEPRQLCLAHLDIAQALSKLGQFADAEKMLDQGEDVVRRFIPDDLESRSAFLGTRATIALLWHGDADRAEALQTQQVDLRRKIPNQHFLDDSLNGLAIIKMQKGDSTGALGLYQECLDIQRKQLGDTHQVVAITLENMANAYYSRKEYDKAIERLDEVLAIRTKLFGSDSFPVARTRFNIGAVATNMGDHRRGLALIDGALVVFRKQLGDKHVEVGQALRIRASCLKGLEDLAGALRDARAALAIMDAAVAPTERGRMKTVADITELLCLQGAYTRAEEMANAALSLLDPNNSGHQKSIEDVRDRLARCRAHRTAISEPGSATQ